MILMLFIAIPLLGGLLAWLAGRWSTSASRWIALWASFLPFVMGVALWMAHPDARNSFGGSWLLDYSARWIPTFGISFHLALDGLSLLLVTLSGFIGTLAVVASWREIDTRVGFFHFNLLWTLAGIMGTFLALDLFLFYFCYELMLVPLYYLIDLWGHERRHYAARKFFIFTQVGGLFLLLGILGLVMAHAAQTPGRPPTFDYLQLLGTPLPPALAWWLMLGFFIAFAVKLPVVPVHNWLPDAHTQAPVAGSVDLAGLLLKVGAYGLLRFVIPLFPRASLDFTPVVMTLAVVGIIYGALVAFGQTDLKRLVAYTSISHMGFVLLGIYAWNDLALLGAIIIMLIHGVTTGALFILVGSVDERMHTRSLHRLSGLWSSTPRIGGTMLFFCVASLGLPGLGNFIGEFLVLLGVYRVSPLFAILASLGFIFALIYSLWIVQRVFYGPPQGELPVSDLSPRETAMMSACIAITVWLGLYPQAALNVVTPALNGLQQGTATSTSVSNRVDAAIVSGEVFDVRH